MWRVVARRVVWRVVWTVVEATGGGVQEPRHCIKFVRNGGASDLREWYKPATAIRHLCRATGWRVGRARAGEDRPNGGGKRGGTIERVTRRASSFRVARSCRRVVRERLGERHTKVRQPRHVTK